MEDTRIELPQWETLPDIGLYMDQVITLMERTFAPFLPGAEITKSMVNNYGRLFGARLRGRALALRLLCAVARLLPGLLGLHPRQVRIAQRTDVGAVRNFVMAMGTKHGSALLWSPRRGVVSCAHGRFSLSVV